MTYQKGIIMMAQHTISDSTPESFLQAKSDRIPAEFERLAAAAQGGTTAEVGEIAKRTIRILPSAGSEHQAYLIFLLGFLLHLERGSAAANAHMIVRGGIADYLRVIDSPNLEEKSRAALLYLLAQLHEERPRILARSRGTRFSAFEWTRLERCLAPLDRSAPVLGRVWPAPAGWTLTDAELAADREWALGLDSARVDFLWERDTRKLLAYCGARAYASLSAPLADEVPQTPVAKPRAQAENRKQPDPEKRAIDVALLRCPRCCGRLLEQTSFVRCRNCAAEFESGPGYLDVSGIDAAEMDHIAENAPMYPNNYEQLMRPAFLRITGANWSNGVTVEDEDRFLTEHLSSATGSVLDLAAGAGRWTAVVAQAVGSDRVIAMDLAAAMVQRLRAELPQVAALRGFAEHLPFAEGSLGAISCWNALQSVTDPAIVVKEIGRCLRPGGVFTLLTFTTSIDPIYRFFQSQHENCFTVRSFAPDELAHMLAAAGLTVRAQNIHGSLVMLAAVRGDR